MRYDSSRREALDENKRYNAKDPRIFIKFSTYKMLHTCIFSDKDVHIYVYCIIIYTYCAVDTHAWTIYSLVGRLQCASSHRQNILISSEVAEIFVVVLFSNGFGVYKTNMPHKDCNNNFSLAMEIRGKQDRKKER